MYKEKILELSLKCPIKEIYAEYSGCGDQGNIDSIKIKDKFDNIIENTTIDSEVMDIVDDFLDEKHGGWENEDGACGKIIINFEDKTIKNEHTHYFTESETDEIEEIF